MPSGQAMPSYMFCGRVQRQRCMPRSKFIRPSAWNRSRAGEYDSAGWNPARKAVLVSGASRGSLRSARTTSRWSSQSTCMPAMSTYSGYSSDVVSNGNRAPSSLTPSSGSRIRSFSLMCAGWLSMLSVRVKPASERPSSTSAISRSSPLELNRTCAVSAMRDTPSSSNARHWNWQRLKLDAVTILPFRSVSCCKSVRLFRTYTTPP
mmetsp:Transcript_41155/g.96765  ORF Transcript_41155/g.96765 Transcript_41155/m.96765 type:complete len:206 (-) Transcript_41155:560-1177(-)